jgi:hypothetical protein
VPLPFLKTALATSGVLRESIPGCSAEGQIGGFGMSITGEPRDREVRAAENQSLFREVNERVKDLNVRFSFVTKVGDWICECANDTCFEHLALSADEYEAIRQDGASFGVATSDEHVLPDVERVTERNTRYWVVEMNDRAGELAKRADPRSHEGPLSVHT